MDGRVVVVTGLPGVGKTTVALHLAALLSSKQETRVLHTDVLKVTLRPRHRELKGPSWVDTKNKRSVLGPFLDRHAQKAVKDGFTLVVEGTLAGAVMHADHRFVLEVADEERRRRIGQKPAAARRALRDTAIDDFLPFMGRPIVATASAPRIAGQLAAFVW